MITIQGLFHADFDRQRSPVATVESGQRVCFTTPDVAWGLENHNPEGGPRAKVEPRGQGPCLVGPVAIRGARPGQTLAITLEEVRPGPWGWTMAGGKGFFNENLNRALGVVDDFTVLRWTLQDGWAHNDLGHRLKMSPFPGMLGMPAAHDGPQCGWTPRRTGGNMDCRHLVAGNQLFLPIEVEGGLLSCGDGHALQADGECSGTAIECPLEALQLKLELLEMPITQPTIKTPGGWVILGFGKALDEAQQQALSAMLDWMAPRLKLSRTQTLALASLCCHLHITQVVNGVVGVQAVWEEDA